eukprot:12023621-Alexandrium_andersonii.AAC.1
MLGFPVEPELATPRGPPRILSSFCNDEKLTDAGRSPASMRHQAGNSMNLAVCGIMWVFALLFVSRRGNPIPADIHELMARVWAPPADGVTA